MNFQPDPTQLAPDLKKEDLRMLSSVGSYKDLTLLSV